MEFIFKYKGAQVGVAHARPENVLASSEQTPSRSSRDVIDLVFLSFEPDPGYAAVQPVFERAWQALENFGFLGPAADPESDVAGQQAAADARRVWSEIELWSTRGQRIPGQVAAFYDHGPGSELHYWVDVVIDRDTDAAAELLS